MFICLIGLIVLGTNKVNAEEEIYEIKVGEGYYETLPEAIAEANSSEKEKILITLLKDISLGEKITITKDITISGDYTILRQTYTGTLFVVNAGAKLTFDGSLTIDGGNKWVFKESEYFAELQYQRDYYMGNLPEGAAAPQAAAEQGGAPDQAHHRLGGSHRPVRDGSGRG